MGRNILIVGDLRSAINYGAVATSDQLIRHFKLLKKPDDAISMIDIRSYFRMTPETGWNEEADEYRENMLSTIRKRNSSNAHKLFVRIRKIRFYKLFRKIWRRAINLKINRDNFQVPMDIHDFELFANNKSVFRYEKRNIDNADLVIINAEGSIVHGIAGDGGYKKDARYVLFMAYLSKVIYKKNCYIINHCVDPNMQSAVNMIKFLYPQMDGIYVREKMSYDKLKELGVQGNIKMVPDALFSYESHSGTLLPNDIMGRIDFAKPYICLGDSSGFDVSLKKIDWDVYDTLRILIQQVKKICPQIVFVDGFMGWNSDIERVIEDENLPRVNLCNCSYEQLYELLKNSEIFISGRWHASILSIIAGTPIISWGADSFKTKALYELIDYRYRFFEIEDLPIHISEICREIELILKDDICDALLSKASMLKEASLENYNML